MAGSTAKTPQNVKGTFISGTPCRLPRLAAKQAASAQSIGSVIDSDQVRTHTRNKLRKLIQQLGGTTSLLDEVEAFVVDHSKTLETSMARLELLYSRVHKGLVVHFFQLPYHKFPLLSGKLVLLRFHFCSPCLRRHLRSLVYIYIPH